MSKTSNLKSYLNNTPLVQQLKSHAKALALSSAMILGIEQASAQAVGTPHVDIMKDTVTGELIFAFKEQPGYEINLTSSGTQTGFTLYGTGGVQWAGANGRVPVSSGMSNHTVLNSTITDNDNIGMDSRAYKIDSLPDGDYHILFTGDTPSGNSGIGVGFSLVNGKIQVNYLEDGVGNQYATLRDNRPQIGTPTLTATNDAIQVPISANAPTSVTSGNDAFQTGNLSTYFPSRSGGPGALTSIDSYANTVSIITTQDNEFIIQDGSTVVANINAQLNLGAGGSSSVQLNVPLGCNVTIDSIKTSHGYNTAGNPNNTNIAWSGITGTGIGVTAVTGLGPILPNPNAPTINASTVTYNVPNIPAGFTPVGTLGGINGTWNSSTNEMTFVNVPVGNNNGTISLGGCSTSINAIVSNSEVPPTMNPIPNQSGTVGQFFNYTIPAATQTNGDPILNYTMTGTLPSGITFDTGTGALSGTPSSSGTYPLSVTATDNDGTSTPENFILTINAIGNNNPVANNDLYTTLEDGTIILTLLSNDTDVDGNTLSIGSINGITLTGGAQIINTINGTVNISAGGVISFIPNANYNGQETFPYTINDGNGGTSTANVIIDIDSVNDNPVANNDAYNTAEDNNVVLSPLTNDTDVDVADVLSISDINGTTITGGVQNINVSNGTVNISAGGVITFVPTINYNGSSTFPYTIDDGNGGTATANVTITVTPVNDLPVANNDTYTVEEDDDIIINPIQNDTDIDGDIVGISSLNATTMTGGAQIIPVNNGTLDISAGGIITFIPNADYNGSCTFPYTIDDGNGGTATANITITVSAINDAPIGNDTEYTLLKNTSQNFDITSQTNDIDGPNATYTISTQPLHGTVVDNGAGQYTYTPDNNFVGEDSLYVTRSDGGMPNESVTVKVKFTVDDDTGIEEINTLDINIYPNPTTEYLSITTPDNVPTVSYEIYDINKRLVDMGDYSNGDHIDMSRFESGVYFIQCTDTSNSQHTAIQRFIKN